MAADPILTIAGLTKRFAAGRSVVDTIRRVPAPVVTAVDGVSVSVRPREIVGVVGESGSGKTTLAKCAVRLVEPDSGTILFRDQDIASLRGSALTEFRRAVQYIFQDPYSSLNPLMTVGEAVSEPALVHGLIDKTQRAERTREMLDIVGLSESTSKRRPRELSGGQRQRVAIARSMAVCPDLLIADEAVSALDVSVQAQILNLLSNLRDEQGIGILFIAHQLSVIAHIADSVQVMYLGVIAESGPVREVFAYPGHPYTRALISAQPGKHRRREHRTPALKDEIPSSTAIPSGCRFRTRCPLVQDVCREVTPPAVDLGAGQTAWCHFAGKSDSDRPAIVAPVSSPSS
jgi:peptide/nickel transport system ATP-binding protein/oligopeptide transport system ATP-binding protein